jgi:hypothetical protein
MSSRHSGRIEPIALSACPFCQGDRTHRLTGVSPNLGGGPWDYIGRIEITDRTAYDAEIATLGKDLIAELYEKYLDKSKTKSIWTKLVDP